MYLYLYLGYISRLGLYLYLYFRLLVVLHVWSALLQGRAWRLEAKKNKYQILGLNVIVFYLPNGFVD